MTETHEDYMCTIFDSTREYVVDKNGCDEKKYHDALFNGDAIVVDSKKESLGFSYRTEAARTFLNHCMEDDRIYAMHLLVKFYDKEKGSINLHGMFEYLQKKYVVCCCSVNGFIVFVYYKEN